MAFFSFGKPDFKQAEQILKNPKASPQDLHQCVSHENKWIREAAMRHPNITADHINSVMGHADEATVARAISHPKATFDHIKAASQHPSQNVRRIAHLESEKRGFNLKSDPANSPKKQEGIDHVNANPTKGTGSQPPALPPIPGKKV